MSVILPDPAVGEKALIEGRAGSGCPTLYLLHGRSDDHTAWLRRTSIERYVAGLNLAVVMPAVERSFYTDMKAGPRYWTFVSEELPYVARYFFPLSARREDTYVAGLSMGGYGAFKLALSHPDRYAAAASLSGALDVVRMSRAAQVAGESEMSHIFGAPETLTNGPNDLFYLSRQVAKRADTSPALYQWCGTSDFLYEDHVRFSRHAVGLNLAVTCEEGLGGHEWSCWDAQIQRVLAWLRGVRHPSSGDGGLP